MKTLFTSILLLSSIALCQGQEKEANGDGIRTITFSVQQSRRLRYHHVAINISLLGSAATVKVKSKAACFDKKCLKSNIDTVYNISKEEYYKIENEAKKISLSDIKAAQVNGLDGVTCTIGMKEDNRSVSYAVWSPGYNTEERKLGAYLEACKLMLKSARLKQKKIL